ncbi:hypothetical protein Tco_0263285, partial [Tanacetum coccineum]
QAPPSPDYVPGPKHANDKIVAEDASPTAQSPDYVPESDPEADSEEDNDKDPDPRRILSIILPMEEMTAMMRKGHQRMMRMMTWTSRPIVSLKIW